MKLDSNEQFNRQGQGRSVLVRSRVLRSNASVPVTAASWIVTFAVSAAIVSALQ